MTIQGRQGFSALGGDETICNLGDVAMLGYVQWQVESFDNWINFGETAVMVLSMAAVLVR